VVETILRLAHQQSSKHSMAGANNEALLALKKELDA
jgi:hypothetical protein